MAASLRAFIAIPISNGPALRRVQRDLDQMGNSVHPVDPAALHLTLKFLGETTWEETVEVTRILKTACQKIPAHTVDILGLGAFPRLSRPMIIWAGLKSAEAVCRLATELNDELSVLGFPREERAFQPHITLARVKGHPPQELSSFVAERPEHRFHGVEINEVCLFQSELHRDGPIYTRLATVPLEDGAGD